MLDKRAFRAVLAQQRALSDRGGCSFSLVLFTLTSGRWSDSEGTAMIRAMRCRLRLTDYVGWFDKRHVGVILPLTDSEGARSFAEDAVSHLARPPGARYRAYVYPSDWSESFNSPEKFEGRTRPQPSAARDDAAVRPPSRTALSGASELEPLLPRAIPFWKHAMDVGFASALLVLTSPLFLILALYIELVSKGPVLFSQLRLGRGGKLFRILKFRTMRVGSRAEEHARHLSRLINSDQAMSKLDKRDARIIPGGRIIRRLCLDELPQLVNVLLRQMSLVGPRPCMPYEAVEYSHWHRERCDVLPGMTGLWQVSGKNLLAFEKMIRLDIAYARGQSLLVDLAILVRTPRAVLVG
jgi:lipopolysaccharide/colanic/teichoic acid biosynthesis glycosyltransferase